MSNRDLTDASPTTRPLAVGPTEAARLLGVGRTKIYELMSGDLVSFKIGTRRLVRVSELERWLSVQQPR